MARVDRSRLARRAAFAGAIAYAIPLAAGLATGHTRDGVMASAGALIVGYADVGGRDRLQAQTLMGTVGCVSVAVLLGSLTQPSLIATVVVIPAWAFLAGLSVSLGARVALVGTLATWSLLLAGDLRLHGQSALRETALIAGGAVLQAAPDRPDAARCRRDAGADRGGSPRHPCRYGHARVRSLSGAPR